MPEQGVLCAAAVMRKMWGMLETRCPACNQRIKFRDDNRGKMLRCPGCKGEVNTNVVDVRQVAPPAPGAGPAGVRPAPAGTIAGMPGAARKPLEEGGPQMPQAVHDTLIGAVCGASWGLGLGLLFGVLAVFGMAPGSAVLDDGLAKFMALVIVVAIAMVAYTVLGSLTGLSYGLTGNEFVGYGVGIACGIAMGILGGGGACDIAIPILFVIFTMRTIDFQSG